VGVLSSTIACGGAAAEGDGSTGDSGSGASDGSASNARSETSAAKHYGEDPAAMDANIAEAQGYLR
jgi:hypothetical protein